MGAHSSKQELDHEAYRALATKHATLRGSLFEQSRIAFRAGDGARAKELSNAGKEHGRLMDHYNNLAKNCLLQNNNATRPKNELDLHGLHVKEAIEVTRNRLQQFQKNKEADLIIIVGVGNNSPGKIAKLKPAITELCQEFRIKVTPNMPNAGCLYVQPLGKDEAFSPTDWISSFFSSIGALLRWLVG